MKPEHLKLAGIVTMVCGGMSSLGAGAMGSDSPMVASGRIIPMQSAPQGAAMDVTDAAAQDSTPVTSAATADFPPALDVPPVPAEAGVSVAASAESRDAQPVNATIALAGGATPVAFSLASNVADVADAADGAHVADVADVPHVADVADVADVPYVADVADVADVATVPHVADAADVATVPHVADVADVATVPHVTDVADVATVPHVADVADVATVPHVADVADVATVAHVPDVADVKDVQHVADAAPVADVAATPATGEVPRDQATLKLGSAVDVITTAAHQTQPADTGADTTRAAVEQQPVASRAAKTEDADPDWASPDLVAVNDNRLDNMRGGFDTGSGLMVSFGITREAFVNGTLVTSTSFNIPNVAQMTPQQAQMLANANAGALIQNGLNNTVQPGGLPGLTGAVIQNTLSNQQIQALTTINTTVNSLAAFKSMNLNQTLNGALLSAVRPR